MIRVIKNNTTVNRKLVSAPQTLHLGMWGGGYFIIISHYLMTSLSLVKIPNCYTKIQILWLLLEMILNRSLAGYSYSELLCS